MSIRHTGDGRRIIDVLKKQTINLIRELFVDDVDELYLYSPQSSSPVTLHGDQVSKIGNYDTDGWKFDLGEALKKTINVLSSCDPIHRKYIILISDRIADANRIESSMRYSNKEWLDANFILIGIGGKYVKSAFECLSAKQQVTYFHVDHPNELNSNLFKEHIDDQDAPCQTNAGVDQVSLSGGHSRPVLWPIRTGNDVDGQSVPNDKK